MSGAHNVDMGGWSSALVSNPLILEIKHSLGFSPPARKWRERQQVPFSALAGERDV